MKRIVGVLVLMFVVVPVLFVIDQAVRTLGTLTRVERERDTWQRPDEVIRQLNLGSAVDLRRQLLAFLWIRAVLGGHWNLYVIRGQADNPR